MSKRLVAALVSLSATFAVPSLAADDTATPDLQCDVGPVVKTFGGTEWKVFSCNDDRHLTFVAAPGSAAGQVIFMLFWENGHWLIMDMGNGTRAANAAHAEIQSLSEVDIMGLIAETKTH